MTITILILCVPSVYTREETIIIKINEANHGTESITIFPKFL